MGGGHRCGGTERVTAVWEDREGDKEGDSGDGTAAMGVNEGERGVSAV